MDLDGPYRRARRIRSRDRRSAADVRDARAAGEAAADSRQRVAGRKLARPAGGTGTAGRGRLPHGPGSTEIWWFTILDRNMPPELRKAAIMRANHTFGPAGMLEQDDGENWDQSTRAARGTVGRRYPLNFAMNLGRGVIRHEPSGLAHIDTHISEHAQLWTTAPGRNGWRRRTGTRSAVTIRYRPARYR